MPIPYDSASVDEWKAGLVSLLYLFEFGIPPERFGLAAPLVSFWGTSISTPANLTVHSQFFIVDDIFQDSYRSVEKHKL